MFYTIYQTTNLTNGKIYVGKHQTNDLEDGYIGSGKALIASIKKYGKQNFKKEILFVFSTENEMNLKEQEIVNDKFVARADTYNLGIGGEGGAMFKNKTHSKQTRDLISQKVRGYKFTEEQSRHLSDSQIGKRIGDQNPCFGRFWITNGKENKLIKAESFCEFQKIGFIKGRFVK